MVLPTFLVGIPTSINPITIVHPPDTPTEQRKLRPSFLEAPFHAILDSVKLIITTNHNRAWCRYLVQCDSLH